MRLTAAQLSALLEGLDWRRVHAARETASPTQAELSCAAASKSEASSPSSGGREYGLILPMARRQTASRRSRHAEGDAAGRAARERAAAPDHQGIAAPSLRPAGRDAAGGPVAARPGGGRAGRGRCEAGRTRQPRPSAGGRGAQAPRRTAERCRRICRGSRCVVDIDDQACPCCQQRAAPDRRGRERAAGHRAGAVPGARRAAAQICLPGLRGCCRAGAGAGAADRGRPADRGDGRPGSGLQICRSPAALSAGPDLRPPGHQSRSLDAGGLGRPRRLPSAPGA